MAVEEFLLFALAAIYFVVPYKHTPGEHGQQRGARDKKKSRHRKHVGYDAGAVVIGLLSLLKRRGS